MPGCIKTGSAVPCRCPPISAITQAFGKALAFPVYQSVGSFTRQMEIPSASSGPPSDNQTELLTVIGDFWQDVMKEAGL